MNTLAIRLLSVYKNSLSVLLKILFGEGCRYQPTCSEYAKEAIERYGILKGTKLSLLRLAKCHPLGGSGYDPVPKIKK